MNSNISILIVDDEEHACHNLTYELRKYGDPDIKISGYAHDTTEAEAMINELLPDAVFFDIEMPGENALSLIERMGKTDYEVVFLTAYDHYAIKAFKLNAVDYLQKPVDREELKKALERLKGRIINNRIVKDALHNEQERQQPNRTGSQGKITLKDKDSIEIVGYKDILFVEARGNYSNIYIDTNRGIKSILMSTPIAEYELLLPTSFFYRVHKSYLLNCSHIEKIVKTDNYQVVVREKYTLPVGRRRYTDLMSFLLSNQFAVTKAQHH